MTPEAWLRVKAIVSEALEQAPETRAVFVAGACREDEALRREVESLLAAHERAGAFIETPATLRTAVAIVKELARPPERAGRWRDSPSTVVRQLERYQVGQDFRGTDRFTVLRQLGAGGMGMVYEVHDRAGDEVVALKTLRHAAAADIYRLKREFRSLADIAHPNVVCLYELIVEAEQCFFTMELVNGVSISEYVRTGSAGGIAARVRAVVPQLVAGLTALHHQGKLHRDIKPSNIMVAPDGRVVILDFGLASDTSSASAAMSDHMAGTPAYFAPERRDGAPPSEASDWYSVGVTLYESLTGQLPSEGTLPPAVAKDLDEICEGLLRRDPHRRLTGGDVLDLLDGERGVRPAARPPRRRSKTLFVGRARPLETLQASLDLAEHGSAAAVYVHGPSGIGKSALIQHFLGPLDAREDVLVLRGRCYEHESVPYKALDGIIDSLSAHLSALPPSESEPLIPRGVAALGRAFPVMLQVDVVSRLPRPETPHREPSADRRVAVSALRELLTRLAERRTLVLFIDDLHWADADSALLLEDLFAPPSPPRLLLLACFRSEEIEAKPFLQALIDRTGFSGSAVIPLEPMAEIEARDLIASLMPPQAMAHHAERIERQAGGNPFLLEQLAHYLAVPERAANQHLAFADMLEDNLRATPPGTRQFLEILAVCGRPMEAHLVHAAAGLTGDERPLVATLRTNYFLRNSGSASRVEVYHDRIREAIVARLANEETRDIHRRVATALRSRGVDDPEMLFEHYHGAGDTGAASVQAAAAARKAFAALAFDRAAAFYRSALDLAPHAAAAASWKEGLAETLTNAGRPRDAADVYLDAAEHASQQPQVDLRRRAAEQLLIGGHIDRGMAVIGTVLRALKMRLAPGPLSAFVSLSWRRARIRWRGLAFVERDAAHVPADLLLRIDTCWSVTTGLAMVDSIRAADFNTRHLLFALEAGEPYRVARALAIEAGFLSTGGGTARDAARFADQAARLAERIGHPHALALSAISNGTAALLAAEWKRAADLFERALSILREQCAGATWETSYAESMFLGALLFQGEIREVSGRLPALLVAARDRGNLYFETELRTRMNLVWLAGDEPDEGERQANQAMTEWSHQGFHRQHYTHVLARVQTELYRGLAEAAWDLIAGNWAAFQRARLLHIRFMKIEAMYLRARAALQMAASAPDGRRFLSIARSDARRMRRRGLPWSRALALLIDAGVLFLEGREAQSQENLSLAATAFEALDMKLYAAVAHRRLAERGSGSDAREIWRHSDAWMSAQGIRNPGRIARLIAPGFPDA